MSQISLRNRTRTMGGYFTPQSTVLGILLSLFLVSFTATAQTFDAPQLNPFGLETTNGMAIPQFADLDGDGDQDLSVSKVVTFGNGSTGFNIQYFENIGNENSPMYKLPVQNPFGMNFNSNSGNYLFHTYGDLDGDGDLDLLTGGSDDGFYFFENKGSAGTPDFSVAPVKNPFGINGSIQFAAPVFYDLDNDGDLDLLGTDYYDGFIYFENTGNINSPAFGIKQLQPFGLNFAFGYNVPSLGDIDGDGDADLFVGIYGGNVNYFRNSGTAGNPWFVPVATNPSTIIPGAVLTAPAMADLDKDNDPDLLIGDDSGVLTYYRNSTQPVSLDEEIFEVVLYPTVTDDFINLEVRDELRTIEILDMKGVVVKTFNTGSLKLPVQELPAGQYFVRIENRYRGQVIRKVRIH